jgi:TATA-box binding protein (TBP) (component of TFIID and TFIIIB)
MKFNSTCIEELNYIKKNLDEETHYKDDYIINQIIRPDGRIKFKDIRKISIGLCKKDITSYRCKKKSAFYNCFVIILRILYNNSYKEIHVKVFNTGKLEIPGIQNDIMFCKTIELLIKIIQPYIPKPLIFEKQKSETVLVNSNFTCNYFINRDKLFELLKYKYRINCNYDPCSYPGIQCKYNIDKDHQMSFMIFRTGSVLIVGKCEDDTIYLVYDYIKEILKNEYANIHEDYEIPQKNKDKKQYFKTKTIYIQN